MSKSPWSAYGRVPPKPEGSFKVRADSPVNDVLKDVLRGREQVASYLDGVCREFFEIRDAGYRQIIADALAPSTRPETIEERLSRLAREAQTRRGLRQSSPGAR